jgi:hypothetical protein
MEIVNRDDPHFDRGGRLLRQGRASGKRGDQGGGEQAGWRMHGRRLAQAHKPVRNFRRGSIEMLHLRA